MKVWKFFKIPDKEIASVTRYNIEDRYPLYAHTNQKYLAERFKKDRDMNKFICMVSKHDFDSKEDYLSWTRSNEGNALDIQQVNTKTYEEGKQKIIQVPIIATRDEVMMIEDGTLNCLDDDGWWNKSPCPSIFKKKYRKALNMIDYVKMFQFHTDPSLFEDSMESAFELDYSSPDWDQDELAQFISIFSDILKK